MAFAGKLEPWEEEEKGSPVQDVTILLPRRRVESCFPARTHPRRQEEGVVFSSIFQRGRGREKGACVVTERKGTQTCPLGFYIGDDAPVKKTAGSIHIESLVG